MNKEILLTAGFLSSERNLDKEIIFKAIEEALAFLTAKRFVDEEVDIRVAIDRKTGEYATFRNWTVVPENAPEEDPDFDTSRHILLSKAKEMDNGLEVDDVLEESIESIEFTRIEAQQFRQFIMKIVNEAQHEEVKKQFERHVGQLAVGTVKRVLRDAIILDLSNGAEGLINRDQLIPREIVRVGDRLRGYIVSVREEKKGPQVSMSRTCPEMLIELFRIEVPEIGEEVIEIKAAARDPGVRAKIAVKTNDGRIDPIGACVGMRGSRVQAVSGELNGERIDIVLWDPNPAQFVINAMAPAEILSIVMDEESHSMDLAVSEEQLSQAIGRNGQNIRLASELTGWTLNVMSEKDAESKTEHEIEEVKELFIENLGIDEDVAVLLIQEGFTSLDEIAYVPEEELLQIEEFDQDIVIELRNRARDALLALELAGSAKPKKPMADLLALTGMTPEIAKLLASHGIVSREDLAEQAVDDLLEISDKFDKHQASALIMQAREHWFRDDENSE